MERKIQIWLAKALHLAKARDCVLLVLCEEDLEINPTAYHLHLAKYSYP